MDYSQQVLDLVNGVDDLATLPEVYIRLRKVLDDPESSMNDLTRVILSDPVLTAKILKLANSAIFGLASRVETVSRAVNLLGTQQTHDLALATIVVDKLTKTSCENMDMDKFWRNSIYCGTIARLLARQCNVLDSERLFIEGLLKDIGHIVMFMKIPDLALEAENRSRMQLKEISSIEIELIGYDYSEVGSALMNRWKLPVSIQTSIRYHTKPSLAEDYLLETDILHIANLITCGIDNRESLEQWLIQIDPRTWELIDLEVNIIDELLQDVEYQASEMMGLIFQDGRRTA